MLIDAKQTHVTKELKHSSPLIGCRFSTDGKYVVFSAQDYRLWRWEWGGDTKVEMAGHESWVRGIAFSPAGSTMVSGGYEGKLIWWDIAAPQPTPLRSVDAHDGWIRALSFSPEGNTVASVGNDRLVKLWDAASGSLLHTLSGHQAHIYNVAFHPSGQLVSGDLKANFIHWDPATGTQVRTFQLPALHKYDEVFRADIGGPHAMCFSPDGATRMCRNYKRFERVCLRGQPRRIECRLGKWQGRRDASFQGRD